GPLRTAGRGLVRAMDAADRLGGNAMGRALHGKGLHGGSGSDAAALVRAIAPHGAPAAVTTRRLILLHGRGALGTADFVITWDVPRERIRDARAAARGVVQRARVEIAFTDGSWAAVVTVPVRDAGPFADALRA
ncbi:MAG: hypothetical protein HOV68_06750, partial [Streptomycetaceae bacterium]|nr:hypothetical protein [Streptomycetaceae bacterium]